MEKQTFKIMIDASRAKVWEILWGDETYREWTSVFSPGSSAKTDWNEGSKVLFGDNEGNGMVSRIAKKKVNEFMSFEHLGEVHNGVETIVQGKTELTVDIDTHGRFQRIFRHRVAQGDGEAKVHGGKRSRDGHALRHLKAPAISKPARHNAWPVMLIWIEFAS